MGTSSRLLQLSAYQNLRWCVESLAPCRTFLNSGVPMPGLLEKHSFSQEETVHFVLTFRFPLDSAQLDPDTCGVVVDQDCIQGRFQLSLNT